MSKDYLEDSRMKCLASGIQLDANLHVDAISQHIHAFETKAEHERNNGIWQDGGITELYETAYNNSDAGLFPSNTLYPSNSLYPVDLVVNVPGGIYYASNGKRLRLATSITSTPNVFLTDTDGVERFLATISGIFFSRQLINKRYLDIAIASDGIHGLGIWADYSALYLDEFLLSDQSITNTATLVGSGAGYSYNLANACICRSNVLTFASVQSTSGVVYCSTTVAKLVVATVAYTITALALTSRSQAGNLVAYYCGGTVVCAVPTATPRILKATSASSWTPWSAVQYTGVDGISMMSQTNMDSSATTLSIAASTVSQTVPNFLITISAGGVVATATAAGSLYSGVANFQMQTGVVSPLGSSGVYKNTGTSKYGQFNMGYSLANWPDTTQPLVNPDLDFNTFAVYLSATASANLSLKSYKNTLSIITGSQANMAGDGGAMINDFGGGDFDADITSGSGFLSSNTTGVFYPPDYRKKESGSPSGFMIYKLNNAKYVLVTFTETANPQFTEIAPGVVSINCLGSTNTILDTNKAFPYENVSGYVASFFTNYTNAASIIYVKRFNKYSNAIDQGLITAELTPISVPTSAFGYKANDFSLYNGSTGAYTGNLIVAPTGTTAGTYYNTANAGTYVFNPNIPISGSSTFGSGFVQLLSATAIQQPAYFGYQFANLLTKSYQAAFILFGQKYLFDGERIYAVTLTNGDVGTINGVPQTRVFANGLRFLAASPTVAYFVSDFDNALYTFTGGQAVTRVQGFSQKPAIVDGVYSVRDDALIMRTASSILTVRSGIITENNPPYTPLASYKLENTDMGVYYVGASSSRIRSYSPLTGSVIIPLDFETAYFGMKDNQRMTVNKIVAYLWYANASPSPFTLSWNWQTQDSSGTDTAIISPACNAQGYARFDWNPPTASVTAGQFAMLSTDTAQKKVLLELVIYYNAESDANLVATNHAS